MSGHPRGDPSGAGRPSLRDRREGRGSRWYLVGEPVPRGPVDVGSHHYCYAFEPSHHWTEYYCQQPELRDYFVRVLDKYELRAALPFRHRGDVAQRGTSRRARWRVAHREPRTGPQRGPRGPLRHQRGGFAEHPAAPRHPGHGFVRRAVVPLGAVAGRPRPHRHTVRAGRARGPAGSRSRRPSPIDVDRLTIFQRTTQWMMPNPLYHATVPPGDRWAMQHLPFYARWFRFVMLLPGHRAGAPRDTGSIRTSRRPDRPRDQRGERAAAPAADSDVDASRTSTTGPTCSRTSIPDYPAMGKRILQDDGSWLRTLKKPNVELVHTAIERDRPEGVRDRRRRRSARPTSSATRPASSTTTSSRRWTSPGDPACRCATSGATSRRRTSGSPIAELPEPLLHVRPGHEPGRTVRACSSTPNARSTTPWTAIRRVLAAGAHRPIEVRRGRARRVRRAATSRRDRPAGVVAPVDRAQPLQEPRGQDLHACRRGAWSCTGSGPAIGRSRPVHRRLIDGTGRRAYSLGTWCPRCQYLPSWKRSGLLSASSRAQTAWPMKRV